MAGVASVSYTHLAKIGLATTAHPENKGVGNFAGMQVEIVWRAVVGFEHSQILLSLIHI